MQVFPGGALGNALKVPETVKNGVAECGHTWMGYDWGADTTTCLFGGYAGSFDTERMLHWIYEGGGLELQRKFRDETAGVYSTVLFIRTAEVFLHSRKPVRTMADMKGLKLRTAGAWLDMAREMGAAPVTTAGRRGLHRARARHHRCDRMGHAVGEYFARLLQGREISDHPRRPPADRALRARASTSRPGPSSRRVTRSWSRSRRSW